MTIKYHRTMTFKFLAPALALMLAAVRPLSCLVGEAAPVDLGLDIPRLATAVERTFGDGVLLWSPPLWSVLSCVSSPSATE